MAAMVTFGPFAGLDLGSDAAANGAGMVVGSHAVRGVVVAFATGGVGWFRRWLFAWWA